MRPAHSLLFLTTAVALLGAAARGAYADETDDTVAQMHFREGTRQFHERDYAGALDHFRRGHQLSHRPVFLYNIALSYENLGDLENAEEYFKTFLFKFESRDPESVKLIEEARLHLGRVQKERAQRASGGGSPHPEIEPLQPTPRSDAVTSPLPAPAPTVAPVAATRPRAPGRRVATWFALGLAVAALGTASGLEIVASSEFDRLRATCAPRCTVADVDPLGAKIDAATGLFITAGVLAVATVILYFVEGRPRDRPTPVLALRF